MQLDISKDVEANIHAKAMTAGFPTVEAFILDQLGLGESSEAAPTSMTKEQWLSKFDTFVAKQTSRNPDFDDSRESIYVVR